MRTYDKKRAAVRDKKMETMYAQGSGVEQIAKKFELSIEGVCFILKRIGGGQMPPTIDVLPPKRIKQAKALLDQGYSEKEVCEAMQIRCFLLKRSIPASVRIPKAPSRPRGNVFKVPYDQLIPQVLKMESDGWSRHDIAEHFGVSKATIDGVMSKYRRDLIVLKTKNR